MEIEPMSVVSGPGAADLIEQLIGLPASDDDDDCLFDLFMIDQDGEPIGDPVGQYRWSNTEPNA
jgi:hypothetical protein